MQGIRLLLLFFVISGLCFGCFNNKSITEKTIEGTWRIADVFLKSNPKADFSTQASLKGIVKQGEIFSFFSNHDVTQINGAGEYLTNHWTFIKGQNKINIGGETSKGLSGRILTDRNYDGTQLYVLTIERGDTVFKFIKQLESLANEKEDPFFSENNKWRIRSAVVEDSALIKEKLLNYLQHLAFIMKAADERKQQIVSFEYSKGPVKIYNGGIGIYSYEITPDSWKQTFSSDSVAKIAYNRYENYLKKNTTYSGAMVGDWIVDDYNILLSIYSDFH